GDGHADGHALRDRVGVHPALLPQLLRLPVRDLDLRGDLLRAERAERRRGRAGPLSGCAARRRLGLSGRDIEARRRRYDHPGALSRADRGVRADAGPGGSTAGPAGVTPQSPTRLMQVSAASALRISEMSRLTIAKPRAASASAVLGLSAGVSRVSPASRTLPPSASPGATGSGSVPVKWCAETQSGLWTRTFFTEVAALFRCSPPATG